MSTRLTPIRIAERELERLAKRETRLATELREVEDERNRWGAVLHALNGEQSTTEATS